MMKLTAKELKEELAAKGLKICTYDGSLLTLNKGPERRNAEEIDQVL